MDISLYRGNANKIVSKAIIDGMIDCGVKLADFFGGSLRNAIPFEAHAVILVPQDKEEARKYFSIVLELDPKDAIAAAELAKLEK